jgi:hypothetical protein
MSLKKVLKDQYLGNNKIVKLMREIFMKNKLKK